MFFMEKVYQNGVVLESGMYVSCVKQFNIRATGTYFYSVSLCCFFFLNITLILGKYNIEINKCKNHLYLYYLESMFLKLKINVPPCKL